MAVATDLIKIDQEDVVQDVQNSDMVFIPEKNHPEILKLL